MLAPRTTSGVRSLWHYAGLHVVEGRLPRPRKGRRADWDPRARLAVLQPGGIAEQIVRHRVPGYRDVYDRARGRLQERGTVEPACVSEVAGGGAALQPWRADRIARTIAAKALLGDLLSAWKAAT
jgi:hypothetical protein